MKSNTHIDIGVKIDLNILLETRLLIQAGSGGGKSYALRKTVEVVAPKKVQQIILDPEGEFVTLREKFDFALVAVTGGDIPLSIKYAEALALKLLETGISAIIDLSGLKKNDRKIFVAKFLDAIMNAPKNLWHHCLIYLDEADVFCPEKEKSVSADAVIDLAARGRKRGFIAVLATQRMSKLSKDAAAECDNKLVGKASLDIDYRRAGEDLGWTSKEQMRSLKFMKPGDFYALGPAISNEPIKFVVGKVLTTHLRPGVKMVDITPTPTAIKKILTKLSSIPEEAERELKTKQDMQAEIARLNRELQTATKGNNRFVKPLADTNDNLIATIHTLENEIRDKNQSIKHLQALNVSHTQQFNKLKLSMVKPIQRLSELVELPAIDEKKIILSKVLPDVNGGTKKIHEFKTVKSNGKNSEPAPPIRKKVEFNVSTDTKLDKCPLAILTFLYTYSDREFSRVQIAVSTGYSVGSGGFKNSIYKLNTLGLIKKNDSTNKIGISNSSEAVQYVGNIEPQEYSVEAYKHNLSKCEREIFEVLFNNPEQSFTRAEIAESTATKYSSESGGFKNSIYKLNSLELTIKEGKEIKLNPELFQLL